MTKFKNYIKEEREEKDDNVSEKIIELFSKNPNPPDKEIHAMAAKLGMEPDKFEERIYRLLGSFLAFGTAKKKGITEKDVDPKELKMGMKVEMEHTDDKQIAKKIALDHLSEMDDYYTRLAKMEKEGEK